MTVYSKVKRRMIGFLGMATTMISKFVFFLNGVEYGSQIKIRGLLKLYNAGTIELGNNVTINSALWANPISAAAKTTLQISGGYLKVGDWSGISNSAISCQKEITIGNHVLIGANCQIFDTDFHPLESRYRFGPQKNNDYIKRDAVMIEDGVFIGTDCIILKGSHIGEGSIIGAGSVVSGFIPAHEIWAGAPAKFIKKAE